MRTFSLLAALATADNNFGNTPRPGLCPEGIPDQEREKVKGDTPVFRTQFLAKFFG